MSGGAEVLTSGRNTEGEEEEEAQREEGEEGEEGGEEEGALAPALRHVLALCLVSQKLSWWAFAGVNFAGCRVRLWGVAVLCWNVALGSRLLLC